MKHLLIKGSLPRGPVLSHLRLALSHLRLLRLPLMAALCLFLGACSVQPWVMPYERQKLADPIMSFDRDPVASSYLGHVYDAREASRGADGSSGGGCGCN